MIAGRKIQILMILVLAVCAGGIYFSKSRFKIVDPEVGRFIAPPPDIVHMTFGFREVLADLLWIRVVQDFGYCEVRDSVKTRSDYEYSRVFKHEVEKVCQKNWVYQMLDRITDLDPKFRIAFQSGGTMLSLLVNDKKGAQALFIKGLQYFPNDWNMLYRAGYHQLFEMQNDDKAAEYLYRASQNGAPPWLAQLSARLYTKEGKAEIGEIILNDFAKSHPDMAGAPRYKELRAKIENELHPARVPASDKPVSKK